MTLSFAPATDPSLPLYVLQQSELAGWLENQPEHVHSWVSADGFSAALGQTVLVPSPDGKPEFALAGYGSAAKRARKRFPLAAAAESLPKGTYRIASGIPANVLEAECFGWLMTGYAFDRYAAQSAANAALVAPEGADAKRIEIMANAEAFIRNLVNTPAADMGPTQLQQAIEDLAQEFGADVSVISGEALLDQNLPMIHAVGRAAEQAPRLLEMNWGDSGPKLTLVGKGVCFDTGGLNLKPGASMGLMKKDMGGAANVLGLARMIMALGLELQLRVLIPAVENSVAGNAIRPGDILTARNGMTVEINNTDAEGRLVLADALALAHEGAPNLLISMATLTGAARVALGPDLAPYYTDDNKAAETLAQAAETVADPVWRMPFHEPYEAMIEPGIADLDNAPSGGFAGSITAALFLRRFADDSRYMHFDIYSWQRSKEPGRSKGGLGQGPRALLAALPELLDL